MELSHAWIVDGFEIDICILLPKIETLLYHLSKEFQCQKELHLSSNLTLLIHRTLPVGEIHYARGMCRLHHSYSEDLKEVVITWPQDLQSMSTFLIENSIFTNAGVTGIIEKVLSITGPNPN